MGGVNGFAGTMRRGRKLWERVDSAIKSWANSRGSGRGVGEGAGLAGLGGGSLDGRDGREVVRGDWN